MRRIFVSRLSRNWLKLSLGIEHVASCVILPPNTIGLAWSARTGASRVTKFLLSQKLGQQSERWSPHDDFYGHCRQRAAGCGRSKDLLPHSCWHPTTGGG